MGIIGWLVALLRPMDAREEGLAAGTGILTGRVAERVPTPVAVCGHCEHPAVVDVLDLVEKKAGYVCTHCAHRWTVQMASSPGDR